MAAGIVYLLQRTRRQSLGRSHGSCSCTYIALICEHLCVQLFILWGHKACLLVRIFSLTPQPYSRLVETWSNNVLSFSHEETVSETTMLCIFLSIHLESHFDRGPCLLRVCSTNAHTFRWMCVDGHLQNNNGQRSGWPKPLSPLLLPQKWNTVTSTKSDWNCDDLFFVTYKAKNTRVVFMEQRQMLCATLVDGTQKIVPSCGSCTTQTRLRLTEWELGRGFWSAVNDNIPQGLSSIWQISAIFVRFGASLHDEHTAQDYSQPATRVSSHKAWCSSQFCQVRIYLDVVTLQFAWPMAHQRDSERAQLWAEAAIKQPVDPADGGDWRTLGRDWEKKGFETKPEAW